jgi:hypothetical protein
VQVAGLLVDDELEELVQFDRHGVSLVSGSRNGSPVFRTDQGHEVRAPKFKSSDSREIFTLTVDPPNT